MHNTLDASMSAQIDAVVERAERLLLRHEELVRTNTLLQEQVGALSSERDALRSRLSAARSRIDALIERLPEQNLANHVAHPVQPAHHIPAVVTPDTPPSAP